MTTFAEQFKKEFGEPMADSQLADLDILAMSGEPRPIMGALRGDLKRCNRKRLHAALRLITYYRNFVAVPRYVSTWFSVELPIVGAAIMGEDRVGWWDMHENITDFEGSAGKRAAYLFANPMAYDIGLDPDVTKSRFIGADAHHAEAAIRALYPDISDRP